MSSTDRTPPRLAVRILRYVLPDDVRDSIDGDLRELYARRAKSRVAAAQLWYWGEVSSFGARFAVHRVGSALRRQSGSGSAPSVLDFKLGARMLRKYPGLALIGGFGMAVATAIGAGSFAFFNTYMYPDLPLVEGDRVVSIMNWNARRGDDDGRVLHDFLVWRAEARSLVDVGAFRIAKRNLIDAAGRGTQISVAEMSAAGFRLTRVRALRGRTLTDDDERLDAPPVVVIGHDVWADRYNSNPDIIGQTIRLGRTVHTIVGVMPAGFAFPVNDSYWIPFRADPSAYAVGSGPELRIFARLAPGVTRDAAQAELSLIGTRMAAEYPSTHADLRPRVMGYTEIFAETGANKLAITLLQSMLALLLVVVSLNVAILVYARTVTRTGEIAVRTALGATRGRVVMQLFSEAIVLSLLSALVGLGIVAVGLRYLDGILDTYAGGAPFWIRPGLSIGTVVYSLGLALLGAVIVGVLPALRATRTQLQSTLSALAGGSKPQLGYTWSALIITQVAITVAVLPPAMFMGRHWVAQAMTKPGFPADEFLSASIDIERDETPRGAGASNIEFQTAMRATELALADGLARDPTVVGATFAMEAPGNHPFETVELNGMKNRRTSRLARVAANYFDVFDVKVIAGRRFNAGDVVAPSARPVIVNRTFAERMPGQGSVIGRLIRFPYYDDTTRRAEWRQIVGLVEDFPAGNVGAMDPGDTKATVYEPMRIGEAWGAMVLVHTRGRADAFSPRLRQIAIATDPALQFRRLETLETTYKLMRRDMFMTAVVLVIGIGSVILLSAAGMYALMSFTVSQRRREIGIRAALGADARRLLGSVLARAARQLALGVVGGLGLVVIVDRVAGGNFMQEGGMFLIPATALFMVIVGILAAMGPARYGLRIQPTEALRSE